MIGSISLSSPQGVCQATELIRSPDVPAEQDEPSRLDSADEVSVRLVDFRSGDAEEQKLTGGGAFHSVQETR